MQQFLINNMWILYTYSFVFWRTKISWTWIKKRGVFCSSACVLLSGFVEVTSVFVVSLCRYSYTDCRGLWDFRCLRQIHFENNWCHQPPYNITDVRNQDVVINHAGGWKQHVFILNTLFGNNWFSFCINLQMLDEQPVPTDGFSQLRHYHGLPLPGYTV